VFIPISAENAFVYRTASRLSFEDFCNLDNTLIEKLGREEVGKQKWRKLSQQEKHQAVYNIVSNASTCAESIEAANFHTFLQALNDCIGGSDKQFKLIEQQLAVARKNLSFEKVIANELPMIANINRLLDKAPLYSTYFWDTYQKCSPRQIQRFLTHMDHRSLHNNMSQLSAYGRFVASTDNDQQELGKVLEKMIALVRVYLRKIVHSIETAREADWSGPLTRQPLYDWGADERGWVDSISGLPVKGQRRKKEPPSNNPHHWERTSPGEWKNKYTDKVVTGSANNPAFGKLSWATLSRRDFCTMSQSILLLAYSKSFCEYFGSEKVMLEEYIHEYNRMINRVLQEYHQLNANDDDDDEVACAIPSPRIDREYAVLYTFLQGAHDETTGEFVPLYPDKYALVARVSMPNRLSDPNHWGHLVWQFSEYADNLNV
jgi:hypothetical protein